MPDLSDLTQLHTLHCRSNNLTHLDLSYNFSLVELDCSKNQLTTLILPSRQKLQYLNVSYNQFHTLPDIEKTLTLKVVNMEYNNFNQFDMPAIAVLKDHVTGPFRILNDKIIYGIAYQQQNSCILYDER
jgi:Leucine-rich repeat (LRR) protein